MFEVLNVLDSDLLRHLESHLDENINLKTCETCSQIETLGSKADEV